jgi:catechol 2,3-dioxygenase-like lactoylglutathione lyase family enzyme
MIAGIDHVQLAAPPGCEEDARRFFGGLLGLEEVPKPDALAARGGVWFRCGPQELHVGVEPAFAPARKAHPGFAVDGGERLHAVASRLSAAGTAVAWDESLAGIARVHAEDPWGNRLEFRALQLP